MKSANDNEFPSVYKPDTTSSHPFMLLELKTSIYPLLAVRVLSVMFSYSKLFMTCICSWNNHVSSDNIISFLTKNEIDKAALPTCRLNVEKCPGMVDSFGISACVLCN